MGRSATRRYTYKNEGGIASETCGDRVKYYEYDYYNRLKKIREGTKENVFDYDAFGNCVEYDGVSLNWERGNLLKNFGDATYSYNIQGQRFKKTIGKKVIQYNYDGGKLLGESEYEYKPRYEGSAPEYLPTEKNDIEYLYDLEGIVGFCKELKEERDIFYLVKSIIKRILRKN